MTTRPAFLQDERGHYPCPSDNCRQTFTRAQGVSRHFNQQHGPQQQEPEPEQDDEVFSDEVEQLHALLYGTPDQDQDDDEQDPPAPATVQLLTAEQIRARTSTSPLATANAVAILADATARLVGIGYDTEVAQEYVLHLIDLLDGRPAA